MAVWPLKTSIGILPAVCTHKPSFGLTRAITSAKTVSLKKRHTGQHPYRQFRDQLSRDSPTEQPAAVHFPAYGYTPARSASLCDAFRATSASPSCQSLKNDFHTFPCSFSIGIRKVPRCIFSHCRCDSSNGLRS